MRQRFGNFETGFGSLSKKGCNQGVEFRWVEKISESTDDRVVFPCVSDGNWDLGAEPLGLRNGLCDGGKSSRSSSAAGAASASALVECRASEPEADPVCLSSGSPGGSVVAEKKKKNNKKKYKKKTVRQMAGESSQIGGGAAAPSVPHGDEVSNDSTDQISEKLGIADPAPNSVLVGMQSSDGWSPTSEQGSAEWKSTPFVEEVGVQCNEQVELEDSKNGPHTGWTSYGKENRHFGWNKRQYNASEGHVNWRNKPSYRNGTKDINLAENYYKYVRGAEADDASTHTSVISSGNNYGKESRHFGWNRKHYYAREGHVHWEKKPSYGGNIVNQADNQSWSQWNSLANILPAPSNSSRHGNAAYEYRKKDAPPTLLNDSSETPPSPKRVNGRLFVSLQGQREGLGNASEKFVGRSTCSFQPVYSNAERGPHHSEADFSQSNAKCVSYHKERSSGSSDMLDDKRYTAGTNGKQIANHGDRNCLNASSMYSNMSTQGALNFVQQIKVRKIPIMEYEVDKSLEPSVDDLPRFHTRHKLEKDASGANVVQQTAVGTKEFRPADRISSATICNELNLIPISSWQLNNSHVVGTRISSHQPISYGNPKIYQSSAEVSQKIEMKSYDATRRGPEETDQLLIGSHMGMKSLTDAYGMQLASETVQMATGCPLAEFEMLIHCATPVIPTHRSQGFLGKHQIPNVSLHSIWNWYEIPGNYGLDVKAVCPETLTGLPNDSMSIHAYFVPSLSAIQLFRPRKSSASEQCNHIRVGSFDVALPDGSCFQGPGCSPAIFSDSELIFEFIEVELPHYRRPLRNKILELIGGGASNPLVFGDPSKLASLNLRDLHPASWFSVAWYPIYQIPEGHLRASFLTYHSLGHFVQGPGSTAAPGCISFPVLGLQSYNTQDEYWFEPKIPSSGKPAYVDTAGILKERLRTLDKNALHFSRGWVYKDNVKVQNKHCDYEFFTSRKIQYK